MLERGDAAADMPLFFSMENVLGQFLRFLHYQIAYMLEKEMQEIGAGGLLLC